MKALALTFNAGVMVAPSGCSSMSGLDTKSEFACKAPDGILCESISDIYTNTQVKNLSGQRVDAHSEAPVELPQAEAGSSMMTKLVYSDTPTRSVLRLLCVRFASWEGINGDLHDQSYMYPLADSDCWLIEYSHCRIQGNYRSVRAPSNVTAQAAQP